MTRLTFTNIIFDGNVNGNQFGFDMGGWNLYTSNDTLNNGIPAFTGNLNDWKLANVQWNGWWPVKTLQNFALLRFCFQSDSVETNKNGWMIDDIKLSLWGYFQHNCSGIEPFSIKNISIFPNPAMDKISFSELPDPATNIRFKIYGIHSKEISQGNLTGNEIKVQQFVPGIYFISLFQKEKYIGTTKFLKLAHE